MRASYVQRIAGLRATRPVVRPPKALFAVRGDTAVAGSLARNARGVVRQGKGPDALVSPVDRSLRHDDEAREMAERGVEKRITPESSHRKPAHIRKHAGRPVGPAAVIKNVQSETPRPVTSPASAHAALRPIPTPAAARDTSHAQPYEIQKISAQESSASNPPAVAHHAIGPVVPSSVSIAASLRQHSARVSSRKAQVVSSVMPHHERSSITQKAQTSQVLVPAAQIHPNTAVPPARAPRHESPRIHIGTVEIKMSSPERRPTRTSSAAPASSLARGTFTSFGIRQG